MASKPAPGLALQRDRSGTSAVMSGLIAVFAFELVVGGPGYWQIGGVSIRRTLFLAVLLSLLVLLLLGRYRLRLGHAMLAAITAAFMVVWIALLPGIYNPRQLDDAVQEGLPLGMLFVGILLHAYYLDRPKDWIVLRHRCGRLLGAAAAAAICVWVVGTFLVEETALVALAVTSYFTLGSERLEPALYIQVMPDGFFRVMWITSTLFAVGLIYALRCRRMLGVCLFSLALFVSYTRALWIAATLGIVLAFVLDSRFRPLARVKPLHVLLLLGALAVVGMSDLSRGAEESVLRAGAMRIASTFSDESAEDRYDQVGPLLDAWQSAPLLGLGMGSSAPGSARSDVAAYLYEMTYLALLMKVGLVGMGVLVAALTVMLWRQPRKRQPGPAHIDACIICFLLACGTNPYLLNLVGLGVLCFLFIDREVSRRHASAGAGTMMPGMKRDRPRTS
jgi:O-antigen ligase